MPKPQAIPKKLLALLDKSAIPYTERKHRTVFTAYDLAATLRLPEKIVAKALVVKAASIVAIAVVSADRRLDTVKLGKALGKATKSELGEAKILNEKAAMKITDMGDQPTAAFGTFYKLPVIIDALLAKQRSAVFPSGSVNASLEMKVTDFMKHENAFVGIFTSARPKPKKQPKPAKKKTAKKTVAKKAAKKSVKKSVKKTVKKAVRKPLKKRR